jgi:hypothetical protein
VGKHNDTVTLEISYRSKHKFIIQPSNHIPWNFPKGAEKYVHIKICPWTFIAALFIIAKLGRNEDVLQ